MIGPVLEYEDLQELCKRGGRPKLATVVRWAEQNGIRFRYDGNGGIWTTVEALNAALGLSAANDDEMYEPHQVLR